MTNKLCKCGCGKPTPLAKTSDKRWGHIQGEALDWLPGHWNHSNKSCNVQECEDSIHGLGYCARHYRSFKKYGDPKVTRYRRYPKGTTAYEVVMARAEIRGDCLEFDARNKSGYGSFTFDGQTQLAHRVVWERAHGAIPKGLVIRHKCDNKPCCLLEHLELGTYSDNQMDALIRGQHSLLFTEKEVLEIRDLYHAGYGTTRLAQRFRCSPSTISEIGLGRSYKQYGGIK